MNKKSNERGRQTNRLQRMAVPNPDTAYINRTTVTVFAHCPPTTPPHLNPIAPQRPSENGG
jgi:hypothetical protein